MNNNFLLEKTIILEPKGNFTKVNTSKLQEELTNIFKNHEYSIILLDLTQVNFIDSGGLSILINAFRQAKMMNKNLNLCSLSSAVKMTFELTQLNNIFPIFPDRQVFESRLK